MLLDSLVNKKGLHFLDKIILFTLGVYKTSEIMSMTKNVIRRRVRMEEKR